MVEGKSYRGKRVFQPKGASHPGKLKKMKKRAQVCEDQAHEEWIEESWYYINEPLPVESAMTDRWDPGEAYFAKVIRGKANYQRFYNLMADKTKVIHLRKMDTLQSNNTLLRDFYRPSDKTPVLDDGGIPGIIRPTGE